MEMVILDKQDAVDWVYRGEGAANLVLAYTGSSSSFVSNFEFYSKKLIIGNVSVMFAYFILFLVWDFVDIMMKKDWESDENTKVTT